MKLPDNLHAFIWTNPTANNGNTYLITGQKNVLIDPGHEHLFGHVRDGLARLSLSPGDIDLVIVTHGHPDHMEGVRLFQDGETATAVHQTEMAFVREMIAQYGNALGVSQFEPTLLLQEGDLQVGDLTFEVIHTPGHSPGSVCLYWPREKALFTGDVVFSQGIGRTDLPGGNGKTLRSSIERIAQLDVDYLLTGHGDPVVGRDRVIANFKQIENYWFAYL